MFSCQGQDLNLANVISAWSGLAVWNSIKSDLHYLTDTKTLKKRFKCVAYFMSVHA